MNEDVPALLSCGADANAVLEQAVESPRDPLTPHQRGCVSCQAALAEFQRLWAPMREAAAMDVRAPRSLLEDVLATLRLAVASPDFAVLDGGRGVTRVAVEVVVQVARLATARVPGVRAALTSAGRDPTAPAAAGLVIAAVFGDSLVPEMCPAKASGTGQPGSDDRGSDVRVGISGSTVAVGVTVAADYGVDLRRLGAEIGDRVRRAVEALTGAGVAAVSVHIDDVLAA